MRSDNLVGIPKAMFEVNQDSFIVRRSQVNGSMQVLNQALLQKSLLYRKHDFISARQRAVIQISETMGQQFY